MTVPFISHFIVLCKCDALRCERSGFRPRCERVTSVCRIDDIKHFK